MTISKLYKRLRSANRRFNKKAKAGHPKDRELFSVFKPVILEYIKEIPSVEETVQIVTNDNWYKTSIRVISNDRMHRVTVLISFCRKIKIAVLVSDYEEIDGNSSARELYDRMRVNIPSFDVYFSRKEIRNFAKTLTEDERAFFILNNVTLFENELLNEKAKKNER